MPYVWCDAMYIEVREGGRVVSWAVLIAMGVNENGEREVLVVQIADKKVESSAGVLYPKEPYGRTLLFSSWYDSVRALAYVRVVNESRSSSSNDSP